MVMDTLIVHLSKPKECTPTTNIDSSTVTDVPLCWRRSIIRDLYVSVGAVSVYKISAPPH